MNKSYHEHCTEEHNEALAALEKAKLLEKNHISITYLIPSGRKVVISVHPRKLKKTLAGLKKAGYTIISDQ